jgi:L-malate glycosyltransferase
MKMWLVSNCFGIFVEKFIAVMEKNGVVFSSISMMKGVKGQRKSKIRKIYDYTLLHFSIVSNIIFDDSDVIYVHFPLQTAPVMSLVRFFSAKKIVLNFHGSDIYAKTKFASMLQFFTKKMVDGADLIVVPSDSIKDAVIEKLGAKNDKIFISPSSGIDFNVFNREKTQPFKSRKYVAGFVSRIDKGKGWETFLNAVHEIKNRGIKDKRKFLMIGNGSEDKSKLKMISELGLGDLIEVKGRIERKDLHKYYRELGVFIFPSMKEGLGLVGLEAMACGISVIGSQTDGISSYLRNGKNGFFFRPGNQIDLADQIIKFISLSQVEINKLEENAFDTATEYEESRVGIELLQRLKETVFPWK